MAKKIICRPAPELEIEIDGGATVLLRFDVNAVAALQEIEGGLGEVLKKNAPELCACIIYAGAKSNNSEFTMEDARKMVAFMSIQDVSEIINEFSDAMGIEENEAQKELSKNLMAQFLNTLK